MERVGHVLAAVNRTYLTTIGVVDGVVKSRFRVDVSSPLGYLHRPINIILCFIERFLSRKHVTIYNINLSLLFCYSK